MNTKTWKAVVGYEGIYQVSDHGDFFILERKIQRRGRYGRGNFIALRKAREGGYISPIGYRYANLQNNGINKEVPIHRLVAIAFIPNPEGKPQVNHRDGNKLNNHVSNLEWVTHQENAIHAHDVLKTPNPPRFVGSNHPISKLKEEDVIKMRGLYPEMTYKAIARLFGVSDVTATRAIKGISWAHV